MSNLTLYDAADELQTLLDTRDGIEDPAQRAEFEQRLGPRIDQAVRKVESFCRCLAHLDSQADLCGQEIERIRTRRKFFADRAAELRAYAIRSMKEHCITKMEAPTVSMRLQPNPAAVVIEDESKIPLEYAVVTVAIAGADWEWLCEESEQIRRRLQNPQVTLSKTAIAAALKADKEVPGARLERGERLVIK